MYYGCDHQKRVPGHITLSTLYLIVIRVLLTSQITLLDGDSFAKGVRKRFNGYFNFYHYSGDLGKSPKK